MLNLIDDKMKKMLFVLAGIIVLFLILLLFLGGEKNYEYSKIEDIMVRSAEKYYADNKNLLPKNDGDSETVSGMRLEDGYMKKLSRMRKDGTICNGEVRVSKFMGNINYIPYLNCGRKYVTTELSQKLIDNSLVNQGAGLYKMGNKYIFRGTGVNNYLKLDDVLFRIMSIDELGNIKIIYDNNTNYVAWDNKYNSVEETSRGINIYEDLQKEDSLISQYADEFMKDEKEISKEILKKLTYIDVCYGSRPRVETDKTNINECSKVAKNKLSGLPTVSDFLIVSLDENCVSTFSTACTNYNYLADMNGQFWTSTPVEGSTSEVYYINGSVTYEYASIGYNFKPIMNVNKNVIYASGDGSINTPYIIK